MKQATVRLDEAKLAPMLKYIQQTWKTLTRSLLRSSPSALLAVVTDPKVAAKNLTIYFPRTLQGRRDRKAYVRSHDSVLKETKISTSLLPWYTNIPFLRHKAEKAGALYLPHEYVTPGGRFNEMYGWDSYFILLGLLSDGGEEGMEKARKLVSNVRYQIENYGKVLNSNRPWSINRSQPPFYSLMVMALYDKTRAQEGYATRSGSSRQILFENLSAMKKDHKYWTSGSRLVKKTGLSRFVGGLGTPSPEVESEKTADGKGHFDHVREYFHGLYEESRRICGENLRRSQELKTRYVRFYNPRTRQLTRTFYRHDRAMRASGFDPSDVFGDFGSETEDYCPVGLNSLLCQLEQDISRATSELGDVEEARVWQGIARKRAQHVKRFCGGESGIFRNYNHRTGRHSVREEIHTYATAFWPYAFGLEEDTAVLSTLLDSLETDGGIRASTDTTSGKQWEGDTVWAPLHFLASVALRRCGSSERANQLDIKLISMVNDIFVEKNHIVEKFNGSERSANVVVTAGYQENVEGFGWTNGVVLALLAFLKGDETLMPKKAEISADQVSRG